VRNGWALASQFYQPLASPVGGVVIAFMFGCVVVFVFFSIAGKILRRSPILRFLVSICLLTIVGIIGYALIDIKWIHPEQYNKPAVDRATITANYVAQPAPAPRHKKPVVQYHPDTRTMADMAPEYQQCAAKTEASIPWVPNRDHTIMIAPGKTDIIEAVHSACDKFDHHSPSMPHYQPRRPLHRR
jgi:hypothetical protein